jgi:hypothetical protein
MAAENIGKKKSKIIEGSVLKPISKFIVLLFADRFDLARCKMKKNFTNLASSLKLIRIKYNIHRLISNDRMLLSVSSILHLS